MGYGLLIAAGSLGNGAYGSQNAPAANPQGVVQQVLSGMATILIPNDPHGDTYFLRAVREGNEEMVRFFLTNPNLNFNATDRDGNTAPMLAIRGGEQDDFGANFREIFNLLVQHPNQNWNHQNSRGQTAILLAVGWGRVECIDALLKIPEVDPNIPNPQGATPLLAAIGNRLVSYPVREQTFQLLIHNLRVDVNRRGPDNKTPFQVAFELPMYVPLEADPAAESRLSVLCVNGICRRNLIDYDIRVRGIVQNLINLLVQTPNVNGEALSSLQNLLVDLRVNVANPWGCPIAQLVDAIRRKIHFVLNELDLDFPERIRVQLQRIDDKVQLIDGFLNPQNSDADRAAAVRQIIAEF